MGAAGFERVTCLRDEDTVFLSGFGDDFEMVRLTVFRTDPFRRIDIPDVFLIAVFAGPELTVPEFDLEVRVLIVLSLTLLAERRPMFRLIRLLSRIVSDDACFSCALEIRSEDDRVIGLFVDTTRVLRPACVFSSRLPEFERPCFESAEERPVRFDATMDERSLLRVILSLRLNDLWVK